MKKLTIVLGAGASKDAWNAGCPRNKDLEPPLAKELFTKLSRPTSKFWEIVSLYPGARELAADLGELAKKGSFDLEKQLSLYAHHESPVIRRKFRYIAPYLCHLLSEISDGYLRGSGHGTYLRLLIQVLANSPHSVCFLTLNYDTLLEQAIAGYESAWTINSFDDYVVEGRPLVIKLHGSVNWFHKVWSGPERDKRPDWRQIIERMDPDQDYEKVFLTKLPGDKRGTFTHGSQGTVFYLYPRLSAPLAEKSEKDLLSKPEHLDAARAFIGDCRKFIFIGTSGQDADLRSLLSETITNVEAAQFVGMEAEAVKETMDRFVRDIPALGLPSGAGSEVFASGFRSYVASEPFQRIVSL